MSGAAAGTIRRSPGRAAAALAAGVLWLTAACSGASGDSAPVDEASSTPAASAETEPGTSLAFEWSANGFEQIEARYQWSGSGVRDDVFEPNFSLSVPETDDVIWSSSCAAGGKVETRLYLAPPTGMQGNRATFRFETDSSAATLVYPARYVADGQYDGFAIVQSASDPMFAEMKQGQWAYIQIGEGSDATKLRISLAKAARSLNAFLPACSGTAKPAQPASATVTASYACEDGRTITASYLGNDSETPVARLVIGVEVLLLQQGVSGSGARYEGKMAGKTYQWLTKAQQGTLIVADADDAAGGAEQITSCDAG
jgi:membrane-bound inhibitor of C-type lysozyme